MTSGPNVDIDNRKREAPLRRVGRLVRGLDEDRVPSWGQRRLRDGHHSALRAHPEGRRARGQVAGTLHVVHHHAVSPDIRVLCFNLKIEQR